jgi:hypothetical protein
LNPKTIFDALEMKFDALESIFEVGFVFSSWVWPEMKNVTGDGLAGDGG